MNLLLAVMLAAPAGPVPFWTLREALALPGVARGGRSPIGTDALRAGLLDGEFQPPTVGATVALPDGSTRAWEALTAGDDGVLQGRSLMGGYAYVAVESLIERVAILRAAGTSVTWVNGEPRAGDPYSYGWLDLPVKLRAGRNDLLFLVGRGRLTAQLLDPPAPIYLRAEDATLPDRLAGDASTVEAGLVLVNATGQPARGLTVEATSGNLRQRTALPTVPPLSLRKVPISLGGGPPPTAGPERWTLTLRRGERVHGSLPIELRVRGPRDSRKISFRSGIDGSPQYYALLPAIDPGARDLVLSLHGASVEAIGQADAYAAKPTAHLVAPTNRRPYGFDWEDWGRRDALEVLDLARAAHAPGGQVYLTGHSMGGHGTWNLGVNAVDRFAAIAPSAGWVSFATYAGRSGPETGSPLAELMNRAWNPSDTIALSRNLHDVGVYVLHGDADDNVPVSEARTMRDALTQRGIPFGYHEQPGAGHWWDAGDEPGAACVDWPGIFDLFGRTRRPEPRAVRRVQFAVANPCIGDRRHWVSIQAQQKPLALATVDLLWDPHLGRIGGTTDNVARLELTPPAPVTRIEIDGGALTIAATTDPICLRRGADGWQTFTAPPEWKNPGRYGPWKEALSVRFQIVYATGGGAADRAWAEAKARFDAETWYYRGNGAVDVLPDTAFDPAAEPDRGVLLIGNAGTHQDWAALLGDSPVQVTTGEVRVGDATIPGDDLIVYLTRPRPGSHRALVATIAPTGPAGRAIGWDNRYFSAGAAWPDLLVLGAEMLRDGIAGIRAAGWFGEDWSLTSGEVAVREG